MAWPNPSRSAAVAPAHSSPPDALGALFFGQSGKSHGPCRGSIRSLMLSSAPILVVDDHPDTVEMLERLLESAGHQVVAVSSAVRAVELLVQGLRPKAIVADERMPQLSGSEMVGFLRRTETLAHTPVLMLSGQELPSMTDPLTVVRRKPLEPDALVSVVNALCLRSVG